MMRTSLQSLVALSLVAAVLLAAAMTALPAWADATTTYSVEDWVLAQGSCTDLDNDTVCGEDPDDLYVPPTRNFLGWTDPAQGRLSGIDYAGVAARYLEYECAQSIDLETSFGGSVKARDVGDGQALVTVVLHTKNALAWVSDDPNGTYDFANTPLLFGARAGDVCTDGATPSVVDTTLKVQYYAPLDDPIVDIGTFAYPFRTLSFQASGKGLLADGSTGKLTVSEVGIFQTQSQSPSFDGFPVEFINLHPVGN